MLANLLSVLRRLFTPMPDPIATRRARLLEMVNGR